MRPFKLEFPNRKYIPLIVWDDNSHEIAAVYLPIEAFTGDAVEIERELSIRDGVTTEFAPPESMWKVIGDKTTNDYVRVIILESVGCNYSATAVLTLINDSVVLAPKVFAELSR